VAKFLFVYRAPGEALAKMTPDERQEHTRRWETWIAEALEQGWMLDPGDGLLPEGRVVSARVITDGPFVETKEMVGGFSLVQADNLDAAAQLAKGCPALRIGGTVEVRPLGGYTAKK
jgi:hypothetical protein